MVADDLAITAHTEHDMQAAMSVAELDTSRDCYKYITKSKVVAVNARKEPTLTLNATSLGWSQKEIHLGIHRTASGDNASTVAARINDARQAASSLRGAGMHGLNGVGLEVVIDEYATYVLSSLLYGLEALVLERNELEVGYLPPVWEDLDAIDIDKAMVKVPLLIHR